MKKRGRPKGSRNKKTTLPIQVETMDQGAVTVLEANLSPEKLEEALANRDKQKKLFLKHLLRQTHEGHWMSYHRKPYLLAPGAHAVAQEAGITIEAPQEKESRSEDDKGPIVRFDFTGAFKTKGTSQVLTGGASSRDDFFKDNGVFKPLSKIETDVRKKAYTNWLNRGIKAILGITELTWQQLGEAGLDVERIQQERDVTRKSKGSDYSKSDNPNTAGLRRDIWRACLIMSMCNVENAGRRLLNETQYKDIPGVNNVDKLSEKRVQYIHRAIMPKAMNFLQGLPEHDRGDLILDVDRLIGARDDNGN